jgi:hypothetical protein
VWVAILGSVGLLTVPSALAGPNEGIVLAWHASLEPVGSFMNPCEDWTLPDSYDELYPNGVAIDGIEWILVVLANAVPLEVNAVVFGLGEYDPMETYIAFYEPCDPWGTGLEIPYPNWPQPGTGTAVTWAPNCFSGSDMVAIYFFGVYAYAPGIIPFGPHPTQGAAVSSCENIGDEIRCLDSYAGFGGANGQNCPLVPEEGACCFDSYCFIMLEEDCWAQGGIWVGGPCDPNPCAGGSPVQETTWGKIKRIYRR